MVFYNGQFSTGSSYQDAAYGALEPQQGPQGQMFGQMYGDQPAMTQAQIPGAVGFQPPGPQTSTLDKILPWVQAIGQLGQVAGAAYGAINSGSGPTAAADTGAGVGAGSGQGFSGEGAFSNTPSYGSALNDGTLDMGDGGLGGRSPTLMNSADANPVAGGTGVGGVNRVGVSLPQDDHRDALGVSEGGGFWDTYLSGAGQGAKLGPAGYVLGSIYGFGKGIVDLF